MAAGIMSAAPMLLALAIMAVMPSAMAADALTSYTTRALKASSTCTSQMPKYCKDFWCPFICSFGFNIKVDADVCARQCLKCCLAIDPTVIFNGGVCGDSAPCKAWITKVTINPDVIPDLDGPTGCGQLKKNLCDQWCEDNCPLGDSACQVSCGPCCRGRVAGHCGLPLPPIGLPVVTGTVPQCKQFATDYPNVYALMCFPGHSTVVAADGRSIRMDELQIGDRVAVMYQDGAIGYEPVYQFSHKESNVLGLSYVKLDIQAVGAGLANATTHSLTLAEKHYLPVVTDLATGATQLVLTQDVKVGQTVLVQSGNAVVPGVVQSKVGMAAHGAFNPYTLAGNIIVDGVVASSHNDWSIADQMVPSSLKPLLPAVYETLLTGHKLGYQLLGARNWAALNERLDMTALPLRKKLTTSMLGATMMMNKQSKST